MARMKASPPPAPVAAFSPDAVSLLVGALVLITVAALVVYQFKVVYHIHQLQSHVHTTLSPSICLHTEEIKRCIERSCQQLVHISSQVMPWYPSQGCLGRQERLCDGSVSKSSSSSSSSSSSLSCTIDSSISFPCTTMTQTIYGGRCYRSFPYATTNSKNVTNTTQSTFLPEWGTREREQKRSKWFWLPLLCLIVCLC